MQYVEDANTPILSIMPIGGGWAANLIRLLSKKPAKCNYNITLPDASDQQWQAQVFFHSDLVNHSATNYDFSVCLTPSTDIKGATIKLC